MTDTNAMLQARYGDPQSLLNGPHNAIIDSLLAHRSVRQYADTPLPEGLLDTLMAAAQSASTSSNLQVWSVVAVQDDARKSRLASLAGGQAHVAKAPLLLLFLADLSRLRRIGAARQAATPGLDYLESFVLGIVDAALAAQNTVVALESLGLGCCFIGAMRNKPEEVAAELNLPPECFVVFGLTVGYPDPASETEIRPRLKPQAILHREQYEPAANGEEATVAEYDAAMHRFQHSQGMRSIDWSRQATSRVGSPEALTGRHRLREALNSLGFKLI